MAMSPVTRRIGLVLVLCCVLGALVQGCGIKDPQSLFLAESISDLDASSVFITGFILSWTAPSEGAGRRVGAYDFRISQTPDILSNWSDAVVVENIPTPADPGIREQIAVESLQPNAIYYVAGYAISTDGIRSEPSGVLEITTGGSLGAIYVSSGASPGGDGSQESPFESIQDGVSRAEATSVHSVLVSAGTYVGTVKLADGVSLYGGFDPDDWTRNTAVNATTIRGGDTFPLANMAVVARDVVSSTFCDGFRLESGEPTTSVYTVYLHDSPGAIISDCTVVVGDGIDGADGSGGVAGSDAACGTGGNGAQSSADCLGNDGIWYYLDGDPGAGGSGLEGDGGAGGDGTYPGYHIDGYDGENGGNGASGSSTANAAGGAWTTLDPDLAQAYPLYAEFKFWHTNDGADGGNGGNGGGGGGGGSSVAYCCDDCGPGYTPVVFSSFGGRGGNGGCGGRLGHGGRGGGGSFGIVVRGGATFRDVRVTGGSGGDGGAGGVGGSGGQGASGQPGQCKSVAVYQAYVRLDLGTWCGGDGGSGGRGGNGGYGGGGAGGPSWCMAVIGQNQLDTSEMSMVAGEGGIGGTGVPESSPNNGAAGTVVTVDP